MSQQEANAQSKLGKIQRYLRQGDLSGLIQETRQYLQWRFRTGRHYDLAVKYDVASSSQHGEDAILLKLLADYAQPYLVDVGAHDGRSWSNSRPFMLKEWHGILIEPLPKVYQELARVYAKNPRATCLELACADRTGQQPLFIGSDGEVGMGSSLSTDQNVWFDAMRSEESIIVQTDTLTNVLDRAGWPQDFGLLLVDAEGMDYEVLLGLDFARYRPAVIVSEEYVVNPEKHAAKYALLRANGYHLHTVVDDANSIWLEESFAVKAQV